MGKIKSFTQLVTWQKGQELVVEIYTVTKEFPKKETYSLTDQVRRCSVSITSNIAEGFSRKGVKEKIQFYHTSKESLTELQNQLLIAKDVGCLYKSEFDKSANKNIEVHKLLNGLIRSTSD